MRLSIKPERVEQQAEDQFDEFIAAKKALEDAKRRYELAETEMLKSMEVLSDKTRVKKDGGKYYRATYTRSMITKVDEEQLQKELGKVKYRKLCDLKLNKKKLEEAVNDGEVPLDVVAHTVAEVPGKAYIRYTEGVDSDDQSS